jgi:alkyl hydroperoxide reductase subunit AhpC
VWPLPGRNPNYLANYKKYHEKGFEMLGVSLDHKGEKHQWTTAIRHDALLWPQVSELNFWSGQVTKLYDIGIVPQNFVIDPQCKIIAVNLRGPALGDKLAELFDK